MSQSDDQERSTSLDRFRRDWGTASTPPQIESYLPARDETPRDQRLKLLIEFVMIDLEFRWRSERGEFPTKTLTQASALPSNPIFEDYLTQFPELGDLANLPIELIGQEYRVRNQWGDRPTHDSYIDRFPKDPAPLRNALAKIDAELANLRLSPQIKADPWAQPTLSYHATDPPPDPTDRERVRYFGEYELISEIARGGMGVVYKARQVKLNRTVALKMILSGELAGDEQVQRFKAEAEAAAKLDHPGIVPIYEIGEHRGQHYFSMSYVDGKSLNAWIKECPLPSREAAIILQKVAEAIAYAHSKGIIHRDLKPGNVLIDPNGEPKVTDFGLAKQTHSDRDLTRTGMVVGTPSYMPPEQAAARGDIGPAADIYSLGAVLYAMLTGRPPFQSSNALDTIIQVLEREPVPPRQLDPKIERDLETICLKCLAKTPNGRYASATDLQDDIQRFLDDQPILARPPGILERASQWSRNHTVTLTTVTALIASAALALPIALEFNSSLQPQNIQDRDINAFVETVYPAITPGRSEAIVQTMSGIIREYPTRAAAWFDRACAYLAQQKDDLAIQDLSKAIELDRSRAEYVYARGLIFIRKEDFDNAIKDLTQAIVLRPDFAAAYFQRAKGWLGKNELSIGLDDVDRAIELHPAFGKAYRLRAEFRKRAGRNDLASIDLLIARQLGAYAP